MNVRDALASRCWVRLDGRRMVGPHPRLGDRRDVETFLVDGDVDQRGVVDSEPYLDAADAYFRHRQVARACGGDGWIRVGLDVIA